MIQFNCPDCGERLQVPDDAAGRDARCPKCQRVTKVPLPEQQGTPFAQDVRAPEEPASSGLPTPFEPPSADSNPYAPPVDPHPTVYFPDQMLATRGQRFGGWLIDNMILIASIMPGGLTVLVAANANGRGIEAYFLIGFGIMVIMAFGVIGINWYLITTAGQTIGKKLVGTRIVRVHDRSLPGFLYGVILRNWVPAAIDQVCSGLFFIVDALFIFGERRQCVHDLIASTQVIHATLDYQRPDEPYKDFGMKSESHV